jgi:2-polyprenyl-6-methoxyphenol hydroxylase-like FAD-dependent oxidoreductase
VLELIPSEVNVLVVGAGPVGLAMAVELYRHGVQCALIDDDEGPTPLNESRALGIQARTQEVFRQLGVVDQVLAEGRPMRGAGIYSNGKRIARLEFELGKIQSAYIHPIILAQSRTERILVDRLAALGGSVAWHTALEGFTQDTDGVSAQVAGPAGARREVRARWLVGCDGSRSAVRHGLGLSFEGGEYEEVFLIADVHIDWSMPDDEIHMELTPEGPLIAFPLPEPGRWRLVDTTGLVDAKEPDSIVARFRDLLTRYVAPGASVDESSWTSSFHIHRRVVNSYRVGRCFVAGDAAHLHSPAGGQGMNTGIQDAFNLAWKLALVLRGLGREVLLDSYNVERRPVAVSVLKGSDRLTRLVTLHNPLARSFRNRLLSLLSGLATVRRTASVQLSELAVNYRGGPIVAEDQGGWLAALGSGLEAARSQHAFGFGPHPGDRLPDVALRPELQANPAWDRLSSALTGPHHHLLFFEGLAAKPSTPTDWKTIEAMIDSKYQDIILQLHVMIVASASRSLPRQGKVLIDPDGSLHRDYGARSACLYLLRPDGYIGYRALPPDASRLRAYLERLLI